MSSIVAEIARLRRAIAELEGERDRLKQTVRDVEMQGAELMARWFRTFDLLPAGRAERAIARADALLAGKPAPATNEPVCGVCLGRPLSLLPCICGDSGLQGDEVVGLRKALYEADVRADAAERLVAELRAPDAHKVTEDAWVAEAPAQDGDRE